MYSWAASLLLDPSVGVFAMSHTISYLGKNRQMRSAQQVHTRHHHQINKSSYFPVTTHPSSSLNQQIVMFPGHPPCHSFLLSLTRGSTLLARLEAVLGPRLSAVLEVPVFFACSTALF
jgi:hypothetical protein